MTSTQPKPARAFILPLIAVLALAGLAISYLARSRQAEPAVPRVDEVARVYIRFDVPRIEPLERFPPPFDAPAIHFAPLLDRLNSATQIPRPSTALNLGYVEVWYRDGEGIRLEVYLIPSTNPSIKSKDLVVSTSDGVWRRDGKFVDFLAEVRSAYRDYEAAAH